MAVSCLNRRAVQDEDDEQQTEPTLQAGARGSEMLG